MIYLELDTKSCMQKLLLRDTFHDFLMVEGSITTFNTFTIDGYLHKEFFDNSVSSDEENEEKKFQDTVIYSTWKQVQDFCLSIIKGKRTPLQFKFILGLAPAAIEKLMKEKTPDLQPETVKGMFLNFHYNGEKLHCTTGTSLAVFTLDKSIEHAFDEWVKEFFLANDIDWN